MYKLQQTPLYQTEGPERWKPFPEDVDLKSCRVEAGIPAGSTGVFDDACQTLPSAMFTQWR